jgi:hypothetical protein
MNASVALRTDPVGWRGLLWRGLLIAALLLAFAGRLDVTVAVLVQRGWDGKDALGHTASLVSSIGPRWAEVTKVPPGTEAARLGFRPGDSIRYDEFLGESMAWKPGEQIALEVARGSQRFRVIATARAMAPIAPAFRSVVLASEVQQLFALGLCAFLLFRGWRSSSAIMLATILVALNGTIPLSFVPHSIAAALFLLWTPAHASISLLWPIFCLEISGGSSNRRMRHVVYALAALITLSTIYIFSGQLLLVPIPFGANVGIGMVDQLLGWSILAINYRHNDAATRNRIKIVFLAFACLLAAVVAGEFLAGLMAEGTSFGQLLPIVLIYTVFGYVALFLLTYAVLRQRLFDFGFAINRTLVYGAVSFTLLAAFGLGEWAIDHLIPESWHQDSALYSAGIALALFLSFHRLRDWFERHVERLFFHSWQQAEAELKRFVASAVHFRQAPALCREFAAEAGRFAQGAAVALYLREENGDYSRHAGSLAGAAESCVDEDRVLALMQSERAPVDMAQAHSTLPGALALPMLDQLGLAGFLLLDARPDGAHYRPDEISNLGWATQQVGLDLQALQARELRAEVASLREQLARRGERKRKAVDAPRAPALAAGTLA